VFETNGVPMPTMLNHDPRKLKTPRERLMYLRDFLRAVPDRKFDMNVWNLGVERDPKQALSVHYCGTAACLGGWTDALMGDGSAWSADEDQTAELLGLTPRQGQALFYPAPSRRFSRERGGDLITGWLATNREAANVIDHLINTGKVNWSKAGGK
jgi:hypothetical protein